MNREHARQLITLLEHVRRRPGMFFPLDQSGLKGFLGGLHAFQKTFLDATDDPTLTAAILRECGWDADRAVVPWPEMDARGFDIHTIITEVLTIEIEVLRRIHGIQ